MASLGNMEEFIVDWSGCDLVERVPGKVGGVPILKHSRLQADAVVLNYVHGSPVDEIEENFGISQDIIRGVLTYAALQNKQIHL